jgi:hypothetical protein
MIEGLKQKWITALEGEEFVQGHFYLKDFVHSPVKHCCLGVLCEIYMREKEITPDSSAFMKLSYNRANGMLIDKILSEVGLEKDLAVELASANDDGKTFAEIAVMIRERA